MSPGGRAVRRAIAMAFAAAMFAGGSASAQQEAGLAAVNAVRKAAGLNALRLNPLLNRAAADHALYLLRNNVRGHEQQAGRPAFTGRGPTDRVRHVGYIAAGVSENIAQGAPTSAAAVEDLMTAIYHRFGFLAADIDELGIGWGPGDPKETPWVFNMSDAGLNTWCSQPPESALFTPPGTYTQMCGPGSARLKAGAVEAQQARLPSANPAWVLWPPPGYDRTPPAFFEEAPDPLPDRSVSGYPISIQFNRFKVKAAVLRGFRLSELSASGGVRDITDIRHLNQRTDPNHEFSGLDFAWFPLQRLAWNTGYRVAADFDVDGQPQHFEWSFRTRDIGMPVIALTGAETVIPMRSGVNYAFYVVPTDRVPQLTGFRWETPSSMKTEADAIDPNTVRVRVTGPACAVGMLSFADGPKIKLQVADPDGVPNDGCAVTTPDFSILAVNERLHLTAGKPYRIQVKPGSRGAGVGNLGWKFPSTMQVTAELEPPDVVRIVVTGRPCDTAQFTLSGGRSFAAIVAGPSCPATTTGKER